MRPRFFPYRLPKQTIFPIFLGALTILVALSASKGFSGEKTLVQLKDFDLTEVKSAGLKLGSDARVRIHALGAGAKASQSSPSLALQVPVVVPFPVTSTREVPSEA